MMEPYVRIRDFFNKNNLDLSFDYRHEDKKWHAVIGEIGKEKTALIETKDYADATILNAISTGSKNAGGALKLLVDQIAGKYLVLNAAKEDRIGLSVPKKLIM